MKSGSDPDSEIGVRARFAAALWALPLQAALEPDAPIIPVVFRWVLATFVILVGSWHRKRAA